MMIESSVFEISVLINLSMARDIVEQFIQSRISLTPELHPMEWYALWMLFIHDDALTLTALAEFFGKKANSFGHIVDKLKQHGYIISQRHLLDHRKRVLKLTDKSIRIRDEFLIQADLIEAEVKKQFGNELLPLLQKIRVLHPLLA